MRRFTLPLLWVVSLTACVHDPNGMYVSPRFAALTSGHQTVAILPFHVSIAPDGLPRNITPQDKLKLEQEEGLALQTQLHNQLMERSGEFTVRFQDIAETNTLLERAGFGYEALNIQDKQDIARLLGVDAVISARVYRSSPNTSAGAIVAVLVGTPAGAIKNVNEVNVDLLLHNADDGALLWTFRQMFTGGVGSSPERMARAMLTSIARRFPYSRKEY